MATKSNRALLDEIYSSIGQISRINDKVRERAFASGREDLWRTYEVGHAAQVALAGYVVAAQQVGDAFYDNDPIEED